MSDFTRRRWLAATSAAAFAPATALPCVDRRVSLDGPGWNFRLASDTPWRDVTVPHTWQVEPAHTEYRGIAHYRRTFEVPREWAMSTVRIEFEAVFHSARVRVNGKPAGEHLRKGYTAFTLDLTKLIRFGQSNTLEVEVDNRFDDAMLPRNTSSDWAHDGGIYRPVSLLVTPPVFIERLEIDAESPTIAARAILRNAGTTAAAGQIRARVVDSSATVTAPYRLGPDATASIDLPRLEVQNPRLWHFQSPHLYTLEAALDNGQVYTDTFGIRKIEVRGTKFYLNGEPVRLMGVERMAGSHPDYGMAEPSSWIEHDHADMQRLHCIYTRVHWPQDRRVLDYCDRHGILIQTEVPAWGPKTFDGMKTEPSAAILDNGLEQLREMIARDRNHPCIFSWGVCNEVNGQNPPAQVFARKLYAESKRLDPKRLVTYASHSLFTTPEKDVAGEMDYIMWNQYYGSWQKGNQQDLARSADRLHAAFPTKPVVISEYGYCACTAERPEGDRQRIAVLLSQDPVLRERDWIAGLIFFCYNDYRTHIGDKGVAVLRQRVHGVVDVYGNRKPSYEVLRRESSPLESIEIRGQAPEVTVVVRTRTSVPSYTLRGRKIEGVLYGAGDIPLERVEAPLPDLPPGQSARVTLKFQQPDGRIQIELV